MLNAKPYNPYILPEELIVALGKPRDIIEHVYSVTEIIQPVRITRLRRQCHKEGIGLSNPPEKMLKALLGTGFHMAMEKANRFIRERDNNNSLIEHPVGSMFISGDMPPVTLTGTFDLYRDKVLSDYKTTSVYAFLLGEKVEWEQQLNLYKYLLREKFNALTVDKLVIKAILVDWKQGKSLAGGDYPSMPFIEKEIKIWDDEDVLDFINYRIELLYQEDLPLCTLEEQWARETQYAVMKGANKKASRVLDSQATAEEWIEDNSKKGEIYSIVKRDGIKMRCEEYCLVKDYCTQYQDEMED